MTTPQSTLSDEQQIRALIEDRIQAVRAKDAAGAMSVVAPDVLVFDVVNPLWNVGADKARQRTDEWFSSFEGPIDYELRDLNIVAGHDVAFCHSLNQVDGTKADGNKLQMWWRATVCFRKIDGKWMITHEHSSVPFDPATGKAALDLEP
jgi:uncharacterized protein (TIGR02246 family)